MVDADDSVPFNDLSTEVDTELNIASGLDSIEANLVLWLDASNINNNGNTGMSNGDDITWADLSGNGNNAVSVANKRPTLTSDALGAAIEFSGLGGIVVDDPELTLALIWY